MECTSARGPAASCGEQMSAIASDFQPFRGYSAWFSVSVEPNTVEQWRVYGGKYAPRDTANFLFSESASTTDTNLLYRQKKNPVCVFRPQWIEAVIKEKNISSVLITKYLLLPPYCITPTTTNDRTIPCTPIQQIQVPPSQRLLGSKQNQTVPPWSSKRKEEATTNDVGSIMGGRGNMITMATTTESCKVNLWTDEKRLKDIIHIDSLGDIKERLIDAVPGEYGLIIVRLD